MASNTAIFYDIENLMGVFNGKTNTGLHLEEIYKRVLDMDGVTGVSIQRAYADWGIPTYRNLKNSVLQVGIEPIQIFNTNQNDRVKNAADICLIIDAVDLAARRPEIQNFVIASGDGIFAFLSKKLHEHGKRVIGCSFDKIANGIFRNSCDYFVGLEKADTAIIAKATARDNTIKPIEPTKKKKQIPPLPKNKFTDILKTAEIIPPQDAGDTSAVMQLACQLMDTLFVEEAKELGGMEISMFASYLTHYVPEFKVRRHGFGGIGEFMRFVLTGSRYCIYSVVPNVVQLGPKDVALAANAKIRNDIEGLLLSTPEGELYNSVFNVPMGVPFVYNKQKKADTKPQKVKNQKAKHVPMPPAPPVEPETPVEATPEAAPSAPTQTEVGGTIRKFAKAQFEALANTLPLAEIKRLKTLEYAKEAFGVRAPILIEVKADSDIEALRLVNGKVKYWRELFQFKGKDYLVYKEWANIHKARLVAWCAAHQK